jgi:hypothetical protein
VEFDTIIYVIAIGASIVGALSKKKKAKREFEQPMNEPSFFGSSFEEQFDIPEETIIPKPVAKDFRTKKPPVVESAVRKMAAKHSAKSQNEKKSEAPIVAPRDKRHPLLRGLDSKDKVKNAVIYSEIFKQKF